MLPPKATQIAHTPLTVTLDDIAGSYRFRHSVVTSQAEIDTLIEDSQQCFDHEVGPLFAADFFDVGTEQYAFLTGHHLVVDLVTWRLLLEELEEILKGGQLLAPALPFQKWAELQREHAESLELDEVLPAVDVPPMDFTYWGIQHQDNTYGNASHASFELGKDLSSAFLTSCHTAYKTEPVEVLLASLIQSWSNVFTDRPVPAIFNEGHGREPWDSEIDITRTVGWFTACRRSLFIISKIRSMIGSGLLCSLMCCAFIKSFHPSCVCTEFSLTDFQYLQSS